MELREYWRIIHRRLWLVLALPLVVLAASLLLRPQAAQGAVASLRLAVGVVPESGQGAYYTFDRYYSWLTAEYLADDLSEIVKSQAFADEVSKRLGGSVRPGAIQGATSPQKLHRILTITVSASSAEQAMEIARAISDTLRQSAGTFLPQLSADNAAIAVIDPPALVPAGPSLRQRLDLPLRIVLAIAAALGLAFLLDYVDESVRDRDDVEALGLTVLAEVPK